MQTSTGRKNPHLLQDKLQGRQGDQSRGGDEPVSHRGSQRVEHGMIPTSVKEQALLKESPLVVKG